MEQRNGNDVLNTINKFKVLYENCINIIDGDSYINNKEQVQFIRKIIINLWEQNTALFDYASAQELALTNISKSDERQKNDIKNLIFVIKKLMNQGEVNTTDLVFYTIGQPEVNIFKSGKIQVDFSSKINHITGIYPSSSDLVENTTVMSSESRDDKDSGLDDHDDHEDTLRKLELSLTKEQATRKQMEETIACLKSENNELKETLGEIKGNFKEMQWALTTEVANKHDQILELRRMVSGLEEQLREAHMQTHFKDENIKKLREELKERSRFKTTGRKLYDVVTEVKELHDRRQTAAMLPPSATDSAKMPTPADSCRQRIMVIRDALQTGKDQLHIQEQMTRNLEFDIRATERGLSKLDRTDKPEELFYNSGQCVESRSELPSLIAIKEKEEEIMRLKDNLNTALKKQEQQEKQLEEKQKVIVNLQEAIKTLKQSEGKKRDGEISSLRFEVCELDLKRRNTQKEIEQIKRELSQLICENDYLREKFRLMICNVIELETQLAKTFQQFEIQEDEKCTLENELKKKETEIIKLHTEVTTLKDNLEKEIKRADTKISNLHAYYDAKIKEKQTEANNVIMSNHELQTMYGEAIKMSRENETKLQDAFTMLKKEGLAKLTEEVNEKHHLECELEAKIQENKDLVRKLRLAEEKAADLSIKLTMCENELEKFRLTLSQCQASLRSEENKCEGYSSLIEKQEMELNNYEDLVNRLRGQLNAERNEKSHLAGKLGMNHQIWEDELKRVKQDLLCSTNQLQEYESSIVPRLEAQLTHVQSVLEHYKIESEKANQSCLTMRKEALELIKSSKAIAEQRMSYLKVNSPISASSLKNALQADFKREKHLAELRADNDQPESGFQSMLQSPNPYMPKTFSGENRYIQADPQY